MTAASWCAAAMCAAVGAATAAAPVVDHVVAMVDREVLTESELFVEARVALSLREGEAAASAPLDAAMLEALRDFVVDQMLVAAQGARHGAPEVPAEAVAQRLTLWRQRFASRRAADAFLQRFGIPEARLYAILRRDLANDRALSQRLRGRLGGSDTQAARAAALRAWLDELRQNVEIRLPGPHGVLELQGRPPGAAPAAAP